MRNKLIVSIFCLFAVMLCCLSAVSAEDMEDTNSTLNLFSDDANHAGEALAADENQMLGESGSFSELQSKINSARTGDTVEFEKDYIYADGDSPIKISKEITIDGKGKTIDGSNQIKIFEITKKVTLKNITFINGKSDRDGGAISLSTGARYSTIDNCKFYDNVAEVDGGAIYVGCWDSKIYNCEFKNNKALCDGSATNIGGGAIYYMYTDAVLANSTFDNNNATKYGGALYINKNNIEISGCKFTNNNAIDYLDVNQFGGGAIMWDGGGSLSKCEFTKNYAFTGSAIYLKSGKLDISDTSLLKNLANASNIAVNSADVVVNDRKATITGHFYGKDNVLNAIFNKGSASSLTFTNVTYYGVDGEMNTGNDKVTCVSGNANSNNGQKPYQDILVSKFEIIFEIYDKNNNLVKSLSDKTNVQGIVKVSDIALSPGTYTIYAIHKADDYYTDLTKKVSTKIVIEKYGTTVTEKNVSDKAFRTIDITVDILDENNQKVQNGTAKFTFNSKNYEATVSDGKATFTNVELPKPGNYTTSVKYITNDYYKASNNNLNIEVLKLDTTTTVDNISGVTGDTVSVEVKVVDEDGNPVTNGSVELTIHYESDSTLGSSQSITLKASNDVQTSDVNDGVAKFSVTLQKPGSYVVTANYLGDTTYNPSLGESNANISKINTTTNQDKNGQKIIKSIKESAGVKKDITVDILTADGTPVKNGTAIMKINGKSYTADVVDGKATFKDVEMPDDNTVAEIYYQGNDWYNPSNSTIDIIIEKNADENETSSDSDDETPSDDDEGSDDNQTSSKSKDVSKSLNSEVSSKATGNPIFALLLVLSTFVYTSMRRRK